MARDYINVNKKNIRKAMSKDVSADTAAISKLFQSIFGSARSSSYTFDLGRVGGKGRR